VREDLNKVAKRVMTVVDPVKLVIENYPEDKEEWVETENNPEQENAGTEKYHSQENYILNVKTSKKKLIINSSD
jgi:glutaminyl-tRNA synthetase